MNDKSKTNNSSFLRTPEEQERLHEEPFEDKALEQFVRSPKESNLYYTFISVSHFFLLFFILCIIFSYSVIGCTKGWIEPLAAIPIVFLSITGIVVLATDTKKNNEKNNEKYK